MHEKYVEPNNAEISLALLAHIVCKSNVIELLTQLKALMCSDASVVIAGGLL